MTTIGPDRMRDLAQLLEDELNPRGQHAGFVVLVFPFDVPPEQEARINYASNADSNDVRIALKQIVATLEGRMVPETRA